MESEKRKELFNNWSLSNEEITKILKQFEKKIKKESYINGVFDEDLFQVIQIAIAEDLCKFRPDFIEAKKKFEKK